MRVVNNYLIEFIYITVDSVTTDYILDLNTDLTQVLGDGD
jgi:hypothetical protein